MENKRDESAAGDKLAETEQRRAAPAPADRIELEPGTLSRRELKVILDSLPVDISFVDANDRVRYFNQPEGRIFTRAKAVIGRAVQQCHPPKSIHLVNRILDEFKSGQRDLAEFWINLRGKLVYIRYLPLRSDDGEYIGCLEVTQDVTRIRELEGEKRLL